VRGDAPPGDFVFVSVSDGVGVGIALGGDVLRGRHNVAGEFGHLPLDIAGPPCACGCGKPTSVVRWADRANGLSKGQAMRFISGHQHRVYNSKGSNFHTPEWFLRRQA